MFLPYAVKIPIICLIAVLFKYCPDVSEEKNTILKEQRELPAVYSFDDPADCFYTSSGALKSQEEENSEPRVYCVAKTFIDPSSPLSRAVEATRGPHRFDRNVLSSGVCIDKCEQLLSLDSRATTNDSQASTREVFHFGSDDLRQKYSSKVQQCVNAGLERYQGTAQASIEFCTTDQGEPYDSLDLFFFVVLFAVLAITVASTVYDYHGGKIEVLRSSSLISNWSKFTQEPGPKDIVFLDCIKVLMQVINLGGHTYMLLASSPHSYSVFFELDRKDPVMWLGLGVNFTNSVFFAISGYLCSVHDAKCLKSKSTYSITDLLASARNRYFRLLPTLAFVILLQSTWAPKLFSGPSWMFFSEREKAFCRTNYWTNMLFLNNFVNLETSCLMPTWYLANDFQLFLLKQVFLYFISKRPEMKDIVFKGIFFTAFLMSTGLAYYHDIKGVYVPSIEVGRDFTRSDSQFNGFNKPTYANFGTYFVGVFFAFLEVDLSQASLRKSKAFQFLWQVTKLLLFFLLVASYVFEVFPLSAWKLALFGGLYKMTWGLVVGVLILAYQNGFGGFWRDLMNAKSWRRLSKLNYAVLLIHTFAFQILVGNGLSVGLLRMTHGLLWCTIVALVAVSYAMAVILFMLIELPAANLYSYFARRPKLRD